MKIHNNLQEREMEEQAPEGLGQGGGAVVGERYVNEGKKNQPEDFFFLHPVRWAAFSCWIKICFVTLEYSCAACGTG